MAPLDSQYEFLSIASAMESGFHTPRNSGDFTAALAIHHHTMLLNGVRYHPYAAQFSYNCDAAISLMHADAVPYDFTVYDELERELQLWVTTRYLDPPPGVVMGPIPTVDSLPASVQKRVTEILTLTEDEQVVRPMELLECLRTDLSLGNCEFADLDEKERFKCLDFLVTDSVMHRLRWKYPRIKTVVGLLASIPVGEDKLATGWSFEETHGIDIWTRQECDGSLSVRCKSVQKQPLFNAISLINEVDLHPQFMPHLARASKLHTILGCGKRAQLLARYIYQMPFPIANRDTVLFAFGCNAVEVEGVEGVIISVQSIPEQLDDWWGYSVPPAEKYVRENLRGMSFVMKPTVDGETELTIIANLDKQVAFIPKSIMNWLIKDMIKGLYKNMVKLSLKFDRTEFAKRVKQNPDFYDWVKDTIEKHKL